MSPEVGCHGCHTDKRTQSTSSSWLIGTPVTELTRTISLSTCPYVQQSSALRSLFFRLRYTPPPPTPISLYHYLYLSLYLSLPLSLSLSLSLSLCPSLWPPHYISGILMDGWSEIWRDGLGIFFSCCCSSRLWFGWSRTMFLLKL